MSPECWLPQEIYYPPQQKLPSSGLSLFTSPDLFKTRASLVAPVGLELRLLLPQPQEWELHCLPPHWLFLFFVCIPQYHHFSLCTCRPPPPLNTAFTFWPYWNGTLLFLLLTITTEGGKGANQPICHHTAPTEFFPRMLQYTSLSPLPLVSAHHKPASGTCPSLHYAHNLLTSLAMPCFQSPSFSVLWLSSDLTLTLAYGHILGPDDASALVSYLNSQHPTDCYLPSQAQIPLQQQFQRPLY